MRYDFFVSYALHPLQTMKATLPVMQPDRWIVGSEIDACFMQISANVANVDKEEFHFLLCSPTFVSNVQSFCVTSGDQHGVDWRGVTHRRSYGAGP